MRTSLWAMALLLFIFTSCDDDDSDDAPTTVTIDSSRPNGNFTSSRAGSFVEQNGTGSAGMAQLGTDTQGTQFLRFSNDFTSNFNTGTITVYLSETNQDLNDVFDPGNGNPGLRIVGPVTSGGEKFFRLDPAAGAQFNYVILWCASAGIPFGNAPLN